jgi:hypothetical protein
LSQVGILAEQSSELGQVLVLTNEISQGLSVDNASEAEGGELLELHGERAFG